MCINRHWKIQIYVEKRQLLTANITWSLVLDSFLAFLKIVFSLFQIVYSLYNAQYEAIYEAVVNINY